MRRDFPYLVEDFGPDKVYRYYVRRKGKKVRIHDSLGSPTFARAYVEAMEVLEAGNGVKGRSAFRAAPEGTLGWLSAQYFGSQRFQRLNQRSQATRRLVIEECLREPAKPGSKVTMAACPLSKVTAAVVMMLMERKAGLPGAANNRKKYLSSMFGWAVKAKHLAANPARDAERVDYASEGFHTWSIEEVRQFEARHPIGTRARLALALLLFLGARRGDMVQFGRQHIRSGELRFIPNKTRYRRMTPVVRSILPALAEVIAKSPCGDLTFLVTAYGKPFTAAGFGNWFRVRCDEAGLPHCSAHGLRKAGATLAADAGASERMLMAMFGWTSPAEAALYTRAADDRKLAAEGARLMATQISESVQAEMKVSNSDLSN